MAISTTRDKLRVILGDTDTDNQRFPDDRLDFFLTERNNNLYHAAADAMDSEAAKWSVAYDFETDGQVFNRSKVAEACRAMAKQFRARAVGVTTVDVTKVDGYSDDIANQDVAAGTVNPRQNFYVVHGVDRLP